MVIPNSVLNEIKENERIDVEKKTENVLILAMSVLHLDRQTTSPIEYKYKDTNGRYIFYSGSQLVPGTKYIATALDAMDKKLDRIIIINTNETLEEAKIKEGKFGISAYEYYKSGVKDYFLCKNSNHSDESSLKTQYTEKEIEGLFTSINKDEEHLQPDQYLWKVSQTIKSNESDKYINLYVDTQGGDRNTIVEINAVIDLLRNRNVSVIKRIAIDFNHGNPVQYIKEVDLQYKTYELFSAMQSFERFGMGGELVEFFKNRESELVETVKILTEAIQLCDMNTFDEAIKKLRVIAQAEKNSPDSKLTIVEQDIIGSYKDILGNINSGDRIIFEEIRWCKEKGYLQQALTLIESKALREVFCSELLYWEPDEFVSDVRQKERNSNYVPCSYDITQKDAIVNAKKRWEDITTYSVVQWCQKCLTSMDYKLRKRNREDFIYDDDFRNAYIRLSDLSKENIPHNVQDDSHNIKLRWSEERGVREYEGTITYLFDKNDADLFRFLRLHMALKNQRNTINHASDDSQRRNAFEEIKNAINIYLELADKLFLDRPNRRSELKEKEVFTFQPEKLTRTKKGFLGRILENDAQAMLPGDKIIKALDKADMDRAIENKETFTVQIIGGSPIPGVHMVKQIR